MRAYIGLGSNLDDPVQQVGGAIKELARLPESSLASQSSLYGSLPLGPQDQPDFVNAVVALDTALPALQLLDHLQAIERQHHRERDTVRWGARTLDLDLLLYGRCEIDHERLRVPHADAHLRAFVLVPLAEIAPEVGIPGRGPVHGLVAVCNREGIWRL
jgi:2-amino-4-hydroxy-6-hydroxymethyldihydropteridine diphosphokinase